MIPTPTISTPVLYHTGSDFFARGLDYSNTDPVAAIITRVITPIEGPTTVNLTLFPEGRQPITRENVLHLDDAAEGEPYFILQSSGGGEWKALEW